MTRRRVLSPLTVSGWTFLSHMAPEVTGAQYIDVLGDHERGDRQTAVSVSIGRAWLRRCMGHCCLPTDEGSLTSGGVRFHVILLPLIS